MGNGAEREPLAARTENAAGARRESTVLGAQQVTDNSVVNLQKLVQQRRKRLIGIAEKLYDSLPD